MCQNKIFKNFLRFIVFFSSSNNHEKYLQFLVGRLLDFVTDVAFSERLLVVCYLESRITIVTFGKALEFPGTPSQAHSKSSSHNINCGGNFENISQCDPKIHVLDLLGPPARRYVTKWQ